MRSTRYLRLAAEGSWIVVGQIATVAGSLVLVRVLTEYLEPNQYGQLALGLTVAGLVSQVVMGGLTAGISRYFSIAAEANGLPQYLQASRRLMTSASAVVFVTAFILTVGLVWIGNAEWAGLVAGALLFSVVGGYSSVIRGIQNAARQRAIVASHSAVDAWLRILLCVGVIHWMGSTSTSVIVGYVISSLLVTFSQLFFLHRLTRHSNRRPHAPENWGTRIWAYARPFSIFGVFTWAHQISDRWALQVFDSTETVGLYAVAFQLGYAPIGLVMNTVVTILGPILYQRSGSAIDRDRNAAVHSTAWRVTVVSLVCTMVGFSFTYLTHEWIFALLVANNYQSISWLFPWMVLAGGLSATGQVLALKLMTEMRPEAMTLAKISTAIFGVAMNICGAIWFGIVGVVASLLAFGSLYLLWMAWLARRPSLCDHQPPQS